MAALTCNNRVWGLNYLMLQMKFLNRNWTKRLPCISNSYNHLQLRRQSAIKIYYQCSLCQNHSFHSSEVFLRKPKINEDRKKDDRLLNKYMPKFKKKSDVKINVWKNMTVAQLAKALNKDFDHIFEVMIYIDGTEDYDSPHSEIDNQNIIQEIVKKVGFRCVFVPAPEKEKYTDHVTDVVKRPPPSPENLVKRPAVVTVMGHVDHGKTTLLDTLRNTSVVSQEFGGITQHIGAFSVAVSSGEKITFLDTPGHAAFSAMRARGAQVTDIVVLVVAADDGVMQQTIESIRHAQDAKVPIIVAINKIDKAQADVEACKKDLLKAGIQLEEFGGEIQVVPISALNGTNINSLIDAILTQAELLELKGDPKGMAEGTIIESRVDPNRGKLSTSIIQRGTLRKGAFLVSGCAWAKVRSMFNDAGKVIQAADPSSPVEIIGWRDLPSAGDEIIEVESEKRAKEIVNYRLSKQQLQKVEADSIEVQKKMEEHLQIYRDERQKRLQAGFFKKRYQPRQKEVQETESGPQLLLLIKGDVDGSIEAILDVLETYRSSECRLETIHYGVGPISENDVELAETFKGIIYGFNVSYSSAEVKNIAKRKNVSVKEFNIIYRLIDDIKEEINSLLPLKKEEEILGDANVIQEFLVTEGKKKWPVAGCRCTKGILKKSALFRLMRNGEKLHEGKLVSLRHLKNEVDSIKKDVECGIRFEDVDIRFQPGDILQCFEMKNVHQKTDWDPGF